MPSQNNTIKYYHLVSGEIEYTELTTEGEPKLPKTKNVDGIYVSDSPKLPAKAMGKIQEMLQMRFHSRYSKTHPSAPEITDVTIFAISFLGSFTNEAFVADAPTGS